MKKTSLIRNFTIYSLIAFFITGFIQILFISNHMTNDELQKIKETAAIILHYAIQPDLTPDDFENSFSDSQVELLDMKFKMIDKEHRIIGMKIWNKSGKLLYSSGVKTNIPPPNEYINTLTNEANHAISHRNNIVKTYNDINETIEVFTPITYDGKTVGAFGISKYYKEMKAHILEVNITVFLIIFIGLFVLYFLLLKIIYNASNTLVLQNKSLIQKTSELELSYDKLSTSYKNTVAALSKSVDARDPYTAGHSERVAKLSVQIGSIMNLSSDKLEILEASALFHDIGKIGIPDKILNKPDKLTEEEFNKIKEHPKTGVDILGNIEFLHGAVPIILHHHERFSGNGYPDGIEGSDIPIESRIIAVADTYDAMTTDRPYRKALSHEEAVDEIIIQQGLQFDREVVQAFLKVLEQGKK